MERPLPLRRCRPPVAARSACVRLRLMLVALSVCLWAVVVAAAPGAAAGARPRVVRAPGRAPERAHHQPRPAPRPHPRPQRPAARGLGGRREHLRGAAGDRRPRAHRGRARRARSASTPRRARSCRRSSQRNRAFVWVRRKVDPATRARGARPAAARASASSPRTAATTRKRELASQVLGYVGLDNTGMSGIEYAFEDLIRGRAAKVTVHIDARRRPVGHTEKPSTDGHTVVLTLDESHPVRGRAASWSRSVAETGADRGHGGGDGPAHGRDPGPGQPARPSTPTASAPTRSARWRNRAVTDAYRAGQHLQDLHRRRRPAGEGGGPRRGDRLRQRLHRGGGHPHQRPRRLRPADLPRRDRQVERRGRRSAWRSAWAARTSTATCATSASARPPASTCPASPAGCCGPPRAGARCRCPPCRSARRSA